MARIVFSEDPTRSLKTKMLRNLSTEGICTTAVPQLEVCLLLHSSRFPAPEGR